LAHSMCKTVLSVSEILTVLNVPNITTNVKKSFVFYLNVVYVKSPYNAAEIGAVLLSNAESVYLIIPNLFILAATLYR